MSITAEVRNFEAPRLSAAAPSRCWKWLLPLPTDIQAKHIHFNYPGVLNLPPTVVQRKPAQILPSVPSVVQRQISSLGDIAQTKRTE